ncbi:hypothetical protein HK101_008797 [Irineochytrium annulatum]|nr:hypothetical protein HK101_008797 [Irineochytrium annulatum]
MEEPQPTQDLIDRSSPSAKMDQKKPNNSKKTPHSTKDPFVFKYLRFSCTDVKKTQEFYISIGMTLDWQIKQLIERPKPLHEKEKPPLNPNKKPLPNPFAKEKAGSAAPAPAALVPDAAAEPVATKTVFSLSFRNPSGDVNEGAVQLFFECPNQVDTTKKEAERHAENVDHEEGLKIGVQNVTATVEPKSSGEYLLIYVHFVSRLIKRLIAKGFEISVPPTEFHETRVAILHDPSGIEVRLVELLETQSEEQTPGAANATAKKPQWFAKLGFYTIATAKSDPTVRLYEKLFSFTTAGKDKRDAQTQKVKMGRVGKKPNSTGGDGFVVQGFRTVDVEEFVIGLTRTRYVWLGNDMRSVASSICFTEKMKADAHLQAPINRSNSRLLSIGFEVQSLESVIKRWEWERPGEVTWDNIGRVRMPTIGQFLSFKDKVNSLMIEIFNARPAETGYDPAVPKDQDAAAAKKAALLQAIEGGVANRVAPLMNAGLAHLHKTYSEGSIDRTGPGVQNLGPLQPFPPSHRSKSAIQPPGRSRADIKESLLGEDGRPMVKTIKVKMQKAQPVPDGSGGGEEMLSTVPPRKLTKLSKEDKVKSNSANF